MDQPIYYLNLIVGGLIVLLTIAVTRFVRKGLHRRRKKREPRGDLLMETLRAQTLREQEVSRRHRESVQAYEALSALHATVMEHMPVAVLVLEPDGRVAYANPHAVAMFAREDPVGLPLVEVAPGMPERFQPGEGHPENLEATVPVTIAGAGRMLHIRRQPLPNGLHLLTLLDRTTERVLEERLRYKRDLEIMGEMAAGIAHEIKNALAVIQGRLQMLTYGDVDRHAGKMREEIDRLLAAVREFMSSSREDAPDFQIVNLTEILSEVAERWRAHPLGDSVRFEAPTGGRWHVRGERRMLVALLHNLVLNAVEACETAQSEQPWVRVWMESRGQGEIALAVEDRGPGIPENLRGKLFVPFVSSKEKGNGMGLFQGRKTLMAHGGRFDIRPDPPTRFVCIFPAASGQNG